jgi:hypothetical protein
MFIISVVEEFTTPIYKPCLYCYKFHHFSHYEKRPEKYKSYRTCENERISNVKNIHNATYNWCDKCSKKDKEMTDQGCPICLEPYSRERYICGPQEGVLGCCHSICSVCYEEYEKWHRNYQRHKVRCPICRADWNTYVCEIQCECCGRCCCDSDVSDYDTDED